MLDKKISQLVLASALTGVEPFPLVQSAVTKKATINQVSDYISSLNNFVPLSGTASAHPFAGNFEFDPSALRKFYSEGDDYSLRNFWDNANGRFSWLAIDNNTGYINEMIHSSGFTQFGCDDPNYGGIVYSADFSANFVDRSIPDCGWVNNQIAAIPVSSLDSVLAVGNSTGANDIIVTNGQLIKSSSASKSQIDFGAGGDEFNISIDGTVNAKAWMSLNNDDAQLYYGASGGYFVDADSATITHGTKIIFDSPIYNFDNLSASTVPYLDASKNLISSSIVPDGNNLFFASGYGIDTTSTGGTDTLNIGATNAEVINIGRAGATVNILGSALYEYAANQYVLDKLITLNYNGAVSSGVGVGFEIEENNIITGYLKTNAARTGFSFLPPAISYYTDFVFSSTSARTKTFQDSSSTIAEYSNKLSVFAATSSAELAGVISDETGFSSGALLVFSKSPTIDAPTISGHATIEGVTATGATGSGKLVFETSPTFTTPVLGVASATEVDITGTGGAGFINFVAQSSNASAPAATGLNLYSGSTGNINWIKKNGSDTYNRKLASVLTADRVYTLPDYDITFASLAGTEVFTNKTLTTPALSSTVPTVAGTMGYDGKVFYSIPVTGQLGLSPSVMYSIVPAGDFNLSTTPNTPQNAFPTTGDVWTLQANTTYEFECMYRITKSGTSCTTALVFALAGGASVTSILYYVIGGSTGAATAGNMFAVTTSSVVTATSTGNALVYFKGIIRMNAGGTVTPQIDFSATPTNPIMRAGSYIKFTPLGTDTNDILGNVA